MADKPDTEEALDLGPARKEPMTALAMGDLHLLVDDCEPKPGVRLRMQLVRVLNLFVLVARVYELRDESAVSDGQQQLSSMGGRMVRGRDKKKRSGRRWLVKCFLFGGSDEKVLILKNLPRSCSE